MCFSCEADVVEGVVNLLIRDGNSGEFGGKPKVVFHVEGFDEVEVLEDESDVVAAQFRYSNPLGVAASFPPGEGVFAGDAVFADEDVATVNRGEAAETVQKRGFARPGLPDDGHEFAFVNVDVHASQHRQVVVLFVQVKRLEQHG